MDSKKQNWIFSDEYMEKLPSFEDKISKEQELKYRVEAILYMIQLSSALKLEHMTYATSVVFFHRFYMVFSFEKYNRFLIGMTCLFLAGKSEENQVKLMDIIHHGRGIANKHFKQSFKIPEENTAYEQELRFEMMKYERLLLQTLHFELVMPNPFIILRDNISLLKKDKSFFQIAWNFLNDSLKTTSCVQYEPKEISAAALLLASLYTNNDLGANWMENKLGLVGRSEIVGNICKKICQLYVGSNNPIIQEKFAHFMQNS